jgi:hypothetical protein
MARASASSSNGRTSGPLHLMAAAHVSFAGSRHTRTSPVAPDSFQSLAFRATPKDQDQAAVHHCLQAVLLHVAKDSFDSPVQLVGSL